MTENKLRLTTAAIRRRLGEPCTLWDTDLPGLGLIVRKRSATFIVSAR
ncbi:MAG: hypothetical protein R3F30_08130 [Planctomycetota bacterium]